MSQSARHHPHEHPLDVMRFVARNAAQNMPCALIMLTQIEGGAVRAPGALMAVTEAGEVCGYLSGGCIDADIALHALAALKNGTVKPLRYGKGSPFLDITLPCGGGIDLVVHPRPNLVNLQRAIDALDARAPATLCLDDHATGFTAVYRPKLRLRIAGRSADPLALSRIAIAAGIETELWSPDAACLDAAAPIAGLKTLALTSPANLPQSDDDAASAFVLMMHDPDWEPPLLAQALTGQAFYIGAVGSPKTHEKRCALLLSQGVPRENIARIHAPIGLVPSLRDASMLAISTLAEIIGIFEALKPDEAITPKVLAHV